MTKVEFTLAELHFAVHTSADEIVQVFCEQQAMVLERISDNIYHGEVHDHQFQFSIEKLSEGLVAVAINGQPWQWMELPNQTEASKFSFMGITALVFKLFKSAKVVKAALAGASVAGYAWLFSWQFAIMLIVCLVIHEYGHVRAMQYFKIKTKGFYLIPFVGGLAVSDDKITTRWQDVVISLMGPAFGLITSVLGVVLYYATELEIFAGVAVLSALLNLFNLLPMLPLDGGHVLKSISFSMRSWVGLLVCLGGVLFGLWVSYTFGLMLLVFFLFIGTLEIVFEWRGRKQSHLIPLDRYGQVFSAVMYSVVVAGHVAVMMHFADSENAILSLPMKILSS
ncbi:site-2 protease family protein [Pseudoalteromonas sp. MMG013]|uniref:site-2 protease family protein n=1 Tax=unclassified Pseudoalteromonas TaxID=194690 RepID=UPI001B371F82|nr:MULTISPECIES: site-2 protease family protein [unclassified Pseudoalteromonas]MBQ4847115.1 site-2 protease family protein [Pseudoalteromonas sp. MMG005]MBQ4852309.1 site-2 protease family protein [Pseudoalteromonas sp. MMG012]MBQ4861379.1 site-2 protease family protein [Pseudoalteromonas sp. MMG013]